MSQIGGLITLDGSPSYNPQGGALSYYWREMGNNPVVGLLSDRTAQKPQVRPWWPGEYRFELIVANTAGLQSDPAGVVIHAPGFAGRVFVGQTGKMLEIPNAAVTVVGQSVTATSDDNGEFVIPALDTWSTLTLKVDATGYNSWQQSGLPVVYNPRPTEVNMQASTSNRWVGKVVNNLNQAGVPNATLDIAPGSGMISLTQGGTGTDAGTFSVESPPYGQQNVVISKAGYYPYVFSIRFPDTLQPRVIDITPCPSGAASRTVSGYVTASGAGIPLVGVQVKLEGVTGQQGQALTAASGSDGYYAIPGVIDGDYRLAASVDYNTAPDMTFLPYVQNIRVNGSDLQQNIEMGGGVFGYYGEVVNEQGLRVQGAALAYSGPVRATVRAAADEAKKQPAVDTRYRTAALSATTDETGYFLMELPQGSRPVTVSAVGYKSQSITADMSGGHTNRTIVLVTPKNGNLTVVLPADAVTAGVQWRVLGESAWRDSGETVALLEGNHVLEFSAAGSWPAGYRTVTVVGEQTVVYTYQRTGIMAQLMLLLDE